MDKVKKYLPFSVLGVFIAVNILIWHSVFYWESRQDLHVTFFDIGQGDATFIETPNGNQILIDGGPNSAILAKLGRLMPFWDRSIDLLILTHPHADHLDGLLEVFRRYDVAAVLESGVEHSIPEYQEWRAAIGEKKTPRVVARLGQKIEAGSGVILGVMSPFESFVGQSPKNIHDAAVVTRLGYGSTSMLFMGDAEKGVEFRLLADASALLGSDILKVGHHGSKTSSSEEFLAAVSPEVAVISAGRRNRYGHPHQEVLDRLRDFGIAVLRTDTDGDVQWASDGKVHWIVR